MGGLGAPSVGHQHATDDFSSPPLLFLLSPSPISFSSSSFSFLSYSPSPFPPSLSPSLPPPSFPTLCYINLFPQHVASSNNNRYLPSVCWSQTMLNKTDAAGQEEEEEDGKCALVQWWFVVCHPQQGFCFQYYRLPDHCIPTL